MQVVGQDIHIYIYIYVSFIELGLYIYYIYHEERKLRANGRSEVKTGNNIAKMEVGLI